MDGTWKTPKNKKIKTLILSTMEKYKDMFFCNIRQSLQQIHAPSLSNVFIFQESISNI